MDVNMGVAPKSPPAQESDSDYNAKLICCMFMQKKWSRDCNAKGLRLCSRLPVLTTGPVIPVLQHSHICT
jgi:hypothetical protein